MFLLNFITKFSLVNEHHEVYYLDVQSNPATCLSVRENTLPDALLFIPNNLREV
jgi:hypothetical protein